MALLVYGSRARGDATEDSDLDLLIATTGGPSGSRDDGAVCISWYPLDHLLRRARSGDLFAFHLVSEGKALFEREPVLTKLRRSFAFRADYQREIRMASDVGWCLLHHASRVVDPASFNRRMAWATHTMLVGAAAEQRRPVFSADGLAAFARCPEAGRVIRSKRDRTVKPEALADFRHVLEHRGHAEPPALPDLAGERVRFQTQRNPAGRAALHPFYRNDGTRTHERSREEQQAPAADPGRAEP
jgi:hypothetical protein